MVDNIFLHKKEGLYDTIILFNVIKYLHLTFGDNAIIKLFEKVYSLLKYQLYL